MTRLRALVRPLAATAVAAALGGAARAELPVDELLAVLPGLWEVELPESETTTRCTANPLEIVIDDGEDGLVYESRYLGVPDSERRSPIRTTPVAIWVQYEGEQRLTPTGEPVAWYLLMPDRDSFYWVREDWVLSEPGARTAMWRRCLGPVA